MAEIKAAAAAEEAARKQVSFAELLPRGGCVHCDGICNALLQKEKEAAAAAKEAKKKKKSKQ
jgi:hypothetical protein